MTDSAPSTGATRTIAVGSGERRLRLVGVGVIAAALFASPVAVAGATTAQAAPTPRSAPTAITAGTFNINNGKVVLGNSSARLDRVANEVRRANFDVFGVQEANTEMRDRLMARIGNTYSYSLIGNSKGINMTGGLIFYRRDLFSAGQNQGAVLLPYPGGAQARYALYQDFYHRGSGSRFMFVSTHLSSTGGRAGSDIRSMQTNHMVGTIRQLNYAGLPLVFVGDMNSNRAKKYVYDAPRQVFLANGLSDVFDRTPTRRNERFNSFNALVRAPAVGGYRPDQLYVDGSIAVVQTEVMVRLITKKKKVKVKVKVKGKTKTKTKIKKVSLYRTPFVSDHNAIRALIVLPAQ